MASEKVFAYKVDSLVGLKPNSFAYLKVPNEDKFEIWVTNKEGIPYALKQNASGVVTISSSDLSIDVNGTSNIDLTVSNTLQALINSALQAGDNISQLINNTGYITTTDLPTNTSNLNNDGSDGTSTYVEEAELSTVAFSGDYNDLSNLPVIVGSTNLSYTTSPSDGKVNSDTGTDATLPLADTTNAGLLSPADKIKLNSTSGINSGDNAANTTSNAYADTKVPYAGASSNVDLGEYQLKTGQLEFDQTPTGTFGVGKMAWNDTDGTLNLGLKGGNVTLQIGQEQLVRVVNKTGGDILEANFQVVKFNGAQGQRPKIALAKADSDINSADTIGVVTETILNNQEGFVTVQGLVNKINTTGSLQGETWADGDILYVSPTTAGNITNIKPIAPYHSVVVGYLIYSHAINGKIYVNVQNGYELEELHNVLVSSVLDNEIVAYDSLTSLWKNKNIITVIGYTPENTTNKSNSVSDIASTTKFPVWKVITDWAISYFDVTKIKSILGISTLSGSNTGDETTSSLKNKIDVEWSFACSDETSSLTTGLVLSFRAFHAMTLSSIKASLNEAPTVSTLIVDIKEFGVSIFSTLLSIDATELTSVTAAIPAVISDINIADDALITIHITQIGSGNAGKGLKITMIGKKV